MKFTVRVLNLDEVPDSQGETFDPAGVELEDGPVWVTLGFDPQKKIGSATLKKVEGGVDAEIDIDGDLPEGTWTPAIGGRTFGDVIVYFYGSDLVSVTEGKRRAQPIYRALSELAKAGRLDDSDQVLNAETNAKNTAYRIPNRPIKAKVGNSYKARYEASLEENKKLRERIEFLVTKNENLVDKLASFLLKPGH